MNVPSLHRRIDDMMDYIRAASVVDLDLSHLIWVQLIESLYLDDTLEMICNRAMMSFRARFLRSAYLTV